MTTAPRIDIAQLAARQLADYDARTPGTIFAEGLTLSVADAYAVQAETARRRQQRGEAVVGYKVGCISPVIQQRLGVDQPVFGRLFDCERHDCCAVLSASNYANLAVEGELAVLLGRDLAGSDLTDDELRQAISAAAPVIELHNHTFSGERPSAGELIANNAIHAGLVAPPSFAPFPDRAQGELTVTINGNTVGAASECAVVENVTRALRFLSAALLEKGAGLAAGQIVLTGSLPDLYDVQPPAHIVVKTASFGEVQASIEA